MLRQLIGIAAVMVAVVKADCQCLAAVGIVFITATVAAVYSPHTTVMREMMPTAIAAVARGIGGRGILQRHRGRNKIRKEYINLTIHMYII